MILWFYALLPTSCLLHPVCVSQIHVITGTDEGTVAEEAHKLFTKLKPEGGDEFSQEIIDGTVANADEASNACGQVIQSLQTLPFFGGGKTVWLKRATFFGSDRTSEAEATQNAVTALLECLQQGLPGDIHFILSTTGLDKRRAFYKFLNKEADVQTFDKPDISRDGWQEQVAVIVRKKATGHSITFSPEALDIFVMLAGEDTRQINSELEKIDVYLGDRREVNEDDVRLLVPLSRAGVIFEIGNALQRKQATRAINLIDQQLARKESAVAILRASIIPTVRNLFMASAVSQGRNIPSGNYQTYVKALESLPETERAWLPQKKTGGVNAYPIFLASRNARNFGLNRLKNALSVCLDADRSLVTTGLDHRVVLHRLVADICTA